MDSDSDNYWRESVSKAKDIIEKNNSQQRNSESDFNDGLDDEQEEEIVDSDLNDDKSQEEDEEEQIYCICRSSDIDRFMIACDKCSEWFHGDCIGVKKKHAKKIKDWFCSKCKKKNPTLQTIFKVKKEKKEKSEKSELDEKISRKDKDKDREQQKRVSRSCGVCSACTRKEDCSNCDYCKDSRKYGGPGKLRQKCRKRQCHHLSKVSKRVSHQSSVEGGNSKDTSSLDIIKEEKEEERNIDEHLKEDEKLNTNKQQQSEAVMTDHSYSMFTTLPPTQRQPSTADGVVGNGPDGESNHQNMNNLKPTPPPQPPSGSTKKKALKVKRANNVKKPTAPKSSQNKTNDKQSKQKSSSSNARKRKSGGKKENHRNDNDAELASKLQKEELLNASRTTRSARKDKDTARKDKEKVVTPPKHCLGPGCVNASRSGSKYCSHECGVQLQIRRLQVILPTRDQHCPAFYHATKLAEDKIDKCREIQQTCQDTLLDLDNKYKSLEEILEKSNDLTILEEDQNDEDKDSDLDLTTYCVSCGIALAPRIAFRHMEKCWAKYECLMSFGAVMKSAGDLFCDTFMAQQQTYCKRLKIMCPEHFKERKIGVEEVCGCPLVDQQQNETGKFCRTARKKCTRHVAWERLRRGAIDLKRVHQWWKLEEAYEQERQLRIEISQRKSVLGALFNDTFDHTYTKPIDTEKTDNNNDDDDGDDIIDVDDKKDSEEVTSPSDDQITNNAKKDSDSPMDTAADNTTNDNDTTKNTPADTKIGNNNKDDPTTVEMKKKENQIDNIDNDVKKDSTGAPRDTVMDVDENKCSASVDDYQNTGVLPGDTTTTSSAVVTSTASTSDHDYGQVPLLPAVGVSR